METTKFTPSVNIIRDADKHLEYIVTPNAEKISAEIVNAFKKGNHAFTLIGSYGTGKSSFIWAFEQSLKNETGYFEINLGFDGEKVNCLNLVGQHQSIIEHFAEQLHVNNDLAGNQRIFDTLYQKYEQNDLLVLAIDEFGKFLEYASKHNPDKELYFLQQLAEFINAPDRNILLLTTLHQSFEAYSEDLANEAQKQEWRKVKGRYHELTFNEPVEQLLLLAAEKFKHRFSDHQKTGTGLFSQLLKDHYVFATDFETLEKVHEDLYPLDLISAIVLTKALQRYGQNERSLFTFLETVDEENLEQGYFNLPKVYDYLIAHFYSFLNTPFNPHYRHWTVLQNAVERVDAEFGEEEKEAALELVKTIGLLQIFAAKGASINQNFLKKYLNKSNSAQVKKPLEKLSNKKILHFTKFNNSYKVFEGTDLDFDEAILRAGESVDEHFNIVPLLEEHFEFPIMTAKAASYQTGTPRLFEFVISEEPILKAKPEGAKDGFINLIFNENFSLEELKEKTQNQSQAICFAFFHQAKTIKDCLFDIQKTKQVKADNNEDVVATRELDNIIKSHENLLQHHVLDALYSDNVSWVFDGEVIPNLNSKKALNHQLSKICDHIYAKAPAYNNELVNKHRISSSIHTARKNFFSNLVYQWHEEDLGFPKDKFPAEKTIYFTLLKQNGMHVSNGDRFELKGPGKDSSFYPLWEECEAFFEEARTDRKPVKELYERLLAPPFKLKQGLIDFWIPTYLFIKRGNYALFEEEVFVPEISDAYLHTITRNPQDYKIKAFQFDDLRVKVFNKYKELIEKEPVQNLSTEQFLDTIKPFLSFYQGLPDYSKQTKKLSKEAMALRNAIAEATDPEDAFFRDFPKALGLDLETLANSDKDLNHFAHTLNEAIGEIKNAYAELLNRIEQFIQDEIVFDNKEFPHYKKKLEKRYKNLKEHQIVKHQKVLLERINAPLNDRDSWLVSIGQAILKKPFNKINDQEEAAFKDHLKQAIEELDNLRDLNKAKKSDEDEVIRLNFTTGNEGMKSKNIDIPKGKEKEINENLEAIKEQLKGAGNLKKAILAKLIKEELDNE